VLHINLRTPRPVTVANRSDLRIATTLACTWPPVLVCLNNAKVGSTSNDRLHASFSDNPLDDDVVVNEPAYLELSNARIDKFSTNNST
jgi:hypothetical protein